MSIEQVANKVKMPWALKIALGLLSIRIFFVLLIVVLQSFFLASPPTSGVALGVWEGLQNSLGDNAKNPAFVMGYSFASMLLAFPIIPAILKRSRGWLKAARICIIIEMLSNFGNVNLFGAIGDVILIILLFSNGAKRYVAKEVQEVPPG